MKYIMLSLIIVGSSLNAMQPSQPFQFPYVNWSQLHHSYTTPSAQADILEQIMRNLNQIQEVVIRHCNTNNSQSLQAAHVLFQQAAEISFTAEHFCNSVRRESACNICHCDHNETLNATILVFLKQYKEREPIIAYETDRMLQQNPEVDEEADILNQMGNLSMQ